ncbi:hypothetical protein [Polyangium fumosum]|uniref:hypothetical protein n=1 Tax=Polyangium fumosum TaxID=889272 RepID=UPI0014781722|nr:hypothetical protein [Polyangium fumosum]
MDLTKRIGLLAALFLVVLAPACKNAEVTGGPGENLGGGGTGGTGGASDGGGGTGGCQDPAPCPVSCPGDGTPPGGPCLVEGEVCVDFDECGYGMRVACEDGFWSTSVHDPGPHACGCGAPCIDPCPEAQPVPGSACDGDFYECSYPEPMCDGNENVAMCKGGTWVLSYHGCLKPCPDTLPAEGTPCNACCASSTCAYLDTSGCPAQIACENGVWASSAASCTPSSACATLDKGPCSHAQGCRWMQWMPIGTCDSLPEGGFPQGCYPVADCASDADCKGGTCKAVAVDPCPDGDCNMCADLAHLCVP